MPLPIGGTLSKAGAPTSGVLQVETSTVVGDITLSGDAEVILTAAGMTGSPITLAVPVDDGTLQVETATVVGTIGAAGAGDAEVIVTAAGMTGSPITTAVAVANNDTAAQVGGKIRTALGLDANITTKFTVGGTGANVSLTQVVPALADDATLNISIDNGTCTGLTAAPTSANTTTGVVADSASVVATKIRAALNANAVIAAFFTISGATDKVILTRKRSSAANDATLNLSVDNGTCTGLTTAANSANTTAGVVGDFRGLESGQFVLDSTNNAIYQNTGDQYLPVWTLYAP